jgi:hypothetical protein
MSRFKKGTSGNPGGRPKNNATLRELALRYTEEAILTVVAIMQDEKTARNTRLAAAVHILDRAFGKPVQSIDSNANISGHLTHENWIDKLDAEDAELRARAMKIGIIAAGEH